MGDLGLKFLGISCYLQAMKQVIGETQAFTSFLADRGEVIIFSSVSMSVWGMMTMAYFPRALETFYHGICDGYPSAVSSFPQKRNMGESLKFSLHQTLLHAPKEACFWNKSPPGHVSGGPHDSQIPF